MPRSMMRFGVVQGLISTYIHENFDRLEVGAELEGWKDIHALVNSVDRLVVTESCELRMVHEAGPRLMLFAWAASPETFPEIVKCRIVVHVYQPSSRNNIDEFAATTGG